MFIFHSISLQFLKHFQVLSMKRESLRFYIYGILVLVVILLITNKGDTKIQPSKIQQFSNISIPSKFNLKDESKFLFVGVLTMISKFHRRSMIRDCYLRNVPKGVHVKFIFGKPKNEYEQNLLDMESSLYDDVVVLDNEENLDDGKTWHFLKWADSLVGYDFLLKTDDDVFLHLENFKTKLSKMKKSLKDDISGVYFGRNPSGTSFMAGAGYILSYDLVHFIANDDFAKNNIVGQEDGILSSWLNHGDRIKHFISEEEEVFFILI